VCHKYRPQVPPHILFHSVARERDRRRVFHQPQMVDLVQTATIRKSTVTDD
jgi:hypothetical protein